jgi:hypothetical protein
VPGSLESVFGQSSAFVGFTAGTGSGFEDQDILSWQFKNSFNPITGGGGVPDASSTLPLLGASLGAIWALARRFRL